MTFSEFIDEGRRLLDEAPEWFDRRVEALDPDDVTMIVYTSGTTGPPKGAKLTSRNALATSAEFVPLLGADETDTILSYLPLCHVAEKIFTFFLPLTAGCVVHFGESVYTVQEDLEEVSPTIFLGVPRIWEKIHARVTLKMKDAGWLKRRLYAFWIDVGREIAERRRTGELGAVDRLIYFIGWLMVFRPLRERLGLADCRHPITGAAPISNDLLEWFHAIGLPVIEGYGQTECAGVSHVNRPDHVKIGTVGQPLPDIEATTVADGEVLVRGPNV
ncbi:MAG: AMP-binding protein, partial [Bradymonadaceae bacterium]